MNGDKKSSNGSCEHDILSWFQVVSENAGLVQKQTLRKILELNCGVEYLKKWMGEMDVEEIDASALESIFTSLVPLVSHSDLEPYIQRIADGDTSPILTHQPITKLSLSSGTTDGKQKYVPFTQHSAETTLQIFRLAAAHRSRIYQVREGGKILEFIYSSNQSKTKGGLTAATATTHYYSSQEFKVKQEKTKSFTCSPEEVISAGDYKQSTYCHLLLGLFFSDQVEYIASAFAYSLVQVFRTFEDLWEELCNDIKYGTLSPRIILPKVRNAVLETISPNPCLALKLEEACTELSTSLDWVGLIPKIWPNAKYVYSIMTGSMRPYLKRLRHYAKDMPLVSADYGSTEGWIGVNVDPWLPPERVTFAVVPTFSYFEFIPLYRKNQDCNSHDGDDFLEDEPIPLSQVKLGQEYELVLTTFTGLYRYRLGDVVEVGGFHYGTPKLNFIFRKKLILTVNIDKNTENDLQVAVEKGMQVLISKAEEAELVDFTSHADISKQPGHYKIFWEMNGNVEEKVLAECCREMDLSFVDHGYVVSRRSHSIGPLELCIVERGAFKKILEYYIANGAALSQYKTPRCTNNQVLLEILHACTVKRVYSTAYA